MSKPRFLTIPQRIDQLIIQHGTLRAVSRELGIDIGNLSKLHRGLYSSPGPETLEKLGLQDTYLYELIELKED